MEGGGAAELSPALLASYRPAPRTKKFYPPPPYARQILHLYTSSSVTIGVRRPIKYYPRVNRRNRTMRLRVRVGVAKCERLIRIS
jgi:hypothetical protein